MTPFGFFIAGYGSLLAMTACLAFGRSDAAWIFALASAIALASAAMTEA